MNLFLHGASDFQIVRGDTLRNPAFFPATASPRSIALSPIRRFRWKSGARKFGPATLRAKFRRDAARQERRLRLGAAHDQEHGAGTGRMAVVLPHGALFRMGKEGEIREKILGMDLLEASSVLDPIYFTAPDWRRASSFSVSARKRTGRKKCSSSMPRRSSRPAGRRMNCCRSTSSNLPLVSRYPSGWHCPRGDAG